MLTEIPSFIAGKAHINSGQKKIKLINPATGLEHKGITFANKSDLDYCVQKAYAAFLNWSQTPVGKRIQVLFKFKELVEKNSNQIAKCITEEHGKTIADAKGEIYRGLEIIEHASAAPQLLKGDYSHAVSKQIDTFCYREALGVCAGITPFNFPAMVPLWMFPIAIACGNSFILKPSEQDPSASLMLAELLTEAGLPDSVFNVLQGDKELVEAILEHPQISAISFVGSTPIAQKIYQTGALYNKKVQALGGAKNHCIIMPDASIEEASNALMGAAFGSAGQRCMAISVAVAIGDKTADKLSISLQEKMKTLYVGEGTDPKSEMGPLISKTHLEKVLSYIELGQEEGAQLVSDGRDFSHHGKEQGHFMGPCLFDRVTENMRIYQEEIFGPVLCLVRATDLDSAIELINKNQFANGVSIFTKNGESARYFSTSIECGMVGVNVAIPVPVGFHSFGGWKDSRYGEPIYGPAGLIFIQSLKLSLAAGEDQEALWLALLCPKRLNK